MLCKRRIPSMTPSRDNLVSYDVWVCVEMASQVLMIFDAKLKKKNAENVEPAMNPS